MVVVHLRDSKTLQNESLPCNLKEQLGQSVWISEYLNFVFKIQLVKPSPICQFSLLQLFPADAESAELTQARVKSDTKWLSSLVLCEFLELFFCIDFWNIPLFFFFWTVTIMSLNIFHFKYVCT